MAKHDTNISSSVTRNLTPFEQHQLAWQKSAHIMQVMQETQLIIDGLQKAQEVNPEVLATVERLADEAIMALATELAEKHGVSA